MRPAIGRRDAPVALREDSCSPCRSASPPRRCLDGHGPRRHCRALGSAQIGCAPRSVGGTPLLLSGKIPARLVVVPPRRGVVSTVTVRVATAAPLGLLRSDAPRDRSEGRPCCSQGRFLLALS